MAEQNLVGREDLGSLASLGKGNTEYVTKYSPEVLEAFKNKFPDNEYVVKFDQVGEFTSLCPKTKQPDFADRVVVVYQPIGLLVESKSLKVYLGSFRNEQSFGEDLANTICRDIYNLLKPKWIRVYLAMSARGGIGWTTCAERKATTDVVVDMRNMVSDELMKG